MSSELERSLGLERTEALAFEVLASLPETGVLVFDRELLIVVAAGRALQVHGYDARQLEGRRLADVLPAPALDGLTPHLHAALGGHRTRFDRRSMDGTRVYDVEVTPLERDGRIVGGLVVSRDVTERERIEHEFAGKAREYRELTDHAGDVLTRTDARGVYSYVSASCERIYGWQADQMVGRSVFSFLHPDDHAAHRRLHEGLADSDQEVVERRFLRADGMWLWVEARCSALRDDRGRVSGVQMSARDISDRRAAEQARRIADEQFRTAFDDALVGMALVSPAGVWLRVNDALCAMLGYSRGELAGLTFQHLTHPDDLGSDLAHVEAVLSGERPGYRMQKRYLRRDGTVVWALLSVSLVRAADGTPQHFIAQIQDMSERARLEARLLTVASLDDLTGLWNRRSLERELAQQLRLVRRHREPAALLVIDLDGFKAVNESFGDACGDALLEHVATVFRSRLRQSDVIARLESDAFAILLPLTGAGGAAVVADALERALSDQPASIGEATITASASIGVAVLDAGLNVDEALRRADHAMQRAKREHEARSQRT